MNPAPQPPNPPTPQPPNPPTPQPPNPPTPQPPNPPPSAGWCLKQKPVEHRGRPPFERSSPCIHGIEVRDPTATPHIPKRLACERTNKEPGSNKTKRGPSQATHRKPQKCEVWSGDRRSSCIFHFAVHVFTWLPTGNLTRVCFPQATKTRGCFAMSQETLGKRETRCQKQKKQARCPSQRPTPCEECETCSPTNLLPFSSSFGSVAKTRTPKLGTWGPFNGLTPFSPRARKRAQHTASKPATNHCKLQGFPCSYLQYLRQWGHLEIIIGISCQAAYIAATFRSPGMSRSCGERPFQS